MAYDIIYLYKKVTTSSIPKFRHILLVENKMKFLKVKDVILRFKKITSYPTIKI